MAPLRSYSPAPQRFNFRNDSIQASPLRTELQPRRHRCRRRRRRWRHLAADKPNRDFTWAVSWAVYFRGGRNDPATKAITRSPPEMTN